MTTQERTGTGGGSADAEPDRTPDTPDRMHALRAALAEVGDVVAAARYPVDAPGADRARTVAAELTAQLDDYLVPRLDRLDAPMLVVVGGSTGAGKSTLVNSLVRDPASPAGVLRPTTRAPVLVAHPDDVPWFGRPHVLPGLPRSRGTGPEPGSLRLVAAPTLTPGLAFLDAPDVDSVVAGNRALARELLAAADLCVFVTSAARYADAVPWDLLRAAQDRGVALAVVLDRIPAGAGEEVSSHLREMLAAHDLGDAPLFAVPESTLDDRGLLAEAEIAPIRDWFARLAADADRRTEVVRQTLDGALAALRPALAVLARASTNQAGALATLRRTADETYAAAAARVAVGTVDGALLHGEVLARWQDAVRTGELRRAVEASAGRLRDRVVAALTGRSAPGRTLRATLGAAVATLVTSAATEAAARAAEEWRGRPAGSVLLAERDDPAPAPDLRERAERLVHDWHAGLLDLVRTQRVGRGRIARGSGYPVNATALLVMLAALLASGTDQAGTPVAGRDLLDAVVTDESLRRLAAEARADLLDRVAALLRAERWRYDTLVDAVPLDPGLPEDVRAAAMRVEEARTAAARGGHRTLPAAPPLPLPRVAPAQVESAAPLADELGHEPIPAEPEPARQGRGLRTRRAKVRA